MSTATDEQQKEGDESMEEKKTSDNNTKNTKKNVVEDCFHVDNALLTICSYLSIPENAELASVNQHFRMRIRRFWKFLLPSNESSWLWLAVLQKWAGDVHLLRVTVLHWLDVCALEKVLLLNTTFRSSNAPSHKTPPQAVPGSLFLDTKTRKCHMEYKQTNRGVSFGGGGSVLHGILCTLILTCPLDQPMPDQDKLDWLFVIERVIQGLIRVTKQEKDSRGGHQYHNVLSNRKEDSCIASIASDAAIQVTNKPASGISLTLPFDAKKPDSARRMYWVSNCPAHALVALVLKVYDTPRSHVLWEVMALLASYGADLHCVGMSIRWTLVDGMLERGREVLCPTSLRLCDFLIGKEEEEEIATDNGNNEVWPLWSRRKNLEFVMHSALHASIKRKLPDSHFHMPHKFTIQS